MSPDAPDGTAAPPKGEPDDTMLIPVVDSGIAPPTRTREVLHSWPFFLVVIWSPAVGLWIACGQLDWNRVVMAVALTVSGLAGIFCALRFWRGSQLDAEARQWYERQAYYKTIEQNPESKFITASNRFGLRLQHNERVIWEFRPHPMDLITRWFRGIFGTLPGRFALAFYALASYLAYQGILPTVTTFLGLGAGLALYIGCITLAWLSTPYALTTQRLIAIHGVFKKRFGGIPRIAIMDQNDATTVPSQLLAWLRVIDTPYGKLVFETPGPVRGNLPENIWYVPHLHHNLTMYSPRPS